MKSIFTIFMALLLSPQVFAKDLTNRLGVGLVNPFSIDLPSVGVFYYPSSNVNLSAAVGVNTTKDNSKFGLMAKATRIVFNEQNLNFYFGGDVGVLSNEVAGKNNSGFEVDAMIGAEFFFTGLENLAFRMEAGLGVTSLDDGVVFRTIADAPWRAGIIFYL